MGMVMARDGAPQQNKPTFRVWGPSLKITLPVLAISLAALGYQGFKSFYIPAYGDRPEDLAYLEGMDPKALLGGDLTHFKFARRPWLAAACWSGSAFRERTNMAGPRVIRLTVGSSVTWRQVRSSPKAMSL